MGASKERCDRITDRRDSMTSAFLQCIEKGCEGRYPLDAKEHQCAACGGLLDVQYDFWRFRELLPFVPAGAEVVSLSEGRTPLVEVNRTGDWAGVRLSIKHQGNNPTGSFKDLGMTACITQATILGSRVTACASTGNTSASMAAYAARAGMKAVVFVPFGKISTAKLAQALEFGAVVIEMGDDFDQAFRMLRELTDELGLYLVNSLNPFRLEGQKTIVFEILEQRDWRVPDYLVLPGGNLGNVSAVGKGLLELRQLGLIDKLPRLVVVQAEGASPFYTMIATGADEIIPVQPRTEASATTNRFSKRKPPWPKMAWAASLHPQLRWRAFTNWFAPAKWRMVRTSSPCSPVTSSRTPRSASSGAASGS
ncbi:MAG: threonine synthase [Acidobacteria bacterium]|nr:MAG: threonine synthase [Acidobacteriota bacterium]